MVKQVDGYARDEEIRAARRAVTSLVERIFSPLSYAHRNMGNYIEIRDPTGRDLLLTVKPDSCDIDVHEERQYEDSLKLASLWEKEPPFRGEVTLTTCYPRA